MPAEIESMASHREVPWHGLGEIVEDAMTAKEALVLAGLDWEVELAPLTAQISSVRQEVINPVSQQPEIVRIDLPEPQTIEVPDQFAVIRDSDQSVFGVVGSQYKPVQNYKSFEFFDTLVASGDAKYETAGSLNGGRRVFMTAFVPREIKIAGAPTEDHRLYLMLATSHDASLAFTVAVTPVRVVCQNTLNLALSGTKQMWRMRHTDSVDGKIAEARDALGMTFQYADQFEAQMNDLIVQEFTKAEFERMVKDVFPGEANKEGRFTDEQYALIGSLESSPTIDDAIRYTKYGALNAIREYDDWGRDYRKSSTKSLAEQRTEATWFGKNVKRSNDVLKFLVDA